MAIFRLRIGPGFVILLALCLLALGSEPTAASAPTLQLVAPAGPRSALDPFTVEVRIIQAANLGAWEFDLNYDPTLVTVTGITVNDFFARNANCDPATARCAILLGPLDEAGSFSAGAISHGQGKGASGDGVIATLQLQPTGRAGNAVLNLADVLLTDVAANPITPATLDATVELVAPAFDNSLYLPLVSGAP